MKFEPIVKSLLDTDLYKISIGQTMFHKHPELRGTYIFKCRNKGVKFTYEMVEEIKEQIEHLCTLCFTEDELNYLRGIRFLKPDYIYFLSLWRPESKYVTINLSDDGELHVRIDGYMYGVMQFEIYLLEIINEVYFRMQYNYDELLKSARERLDSKIVDFNSGKYTFRFAEFGARRRLSREFQDEMVRRFATETKNCVGTSNVYLAKKYSLIPIGTYAHEFVEMYQGIPTIPIAYCNYYAMKDWYDEYKGDNGIALTDTIGTDTFLLDFGRDMANMYKGVRHDSGDPYEWSRKIIAHYESLGIDPKTKTLLFSDSLNFDKAQALYDTFKDKTNVSFGIGTFCSNDTGVEPLNIVIKLQYVNERPVAKLSDAPGKTMCPDEEYVRYLNEAVKFRFNES